MWPNDPSSPTAGGKGGGAHRDNQKTTDAERSGTPAVAVQRIVRHPFLYIKNLPN